MLGRMSPRALAAASLLAAGCHAVSPPPIMPMHGGTAPHADGATTVTLVFGVAGELFGGDGVGFALRGERQLDDGTAVGVQLTGGKGQEGEGFRLKDDRPSRSVPLRHWLAEVRGYGRLTSADRDWVSATGSVGLTAMDTGLLAATLGVGGAVSYPNDYLVPALGVFGAVSQPLRRGDPMGPDGDKHMHRTWWFAFSGGLVVPIGDTGNAVSVEAGAALGFGHNEGAQLSGSIADSHTF
jgi:hypothetical protein